MLMSLTLIIESSCDDETNSITEKEIFVQSVIMPYTVFTQENFEIEFEISVSGCET